MTNPTQTTLEQIEALISKYENYHVFAIGLFILLLIIQIFQSIFISNKIEGFKNNLKKSEIKFSRFSNMQVDALKSIYNQIVTFHYAHHRLFFPTSVSHDSLIVRIDQWKADSIKLLDALHRERILLPPDLVVLVKDFETDLRRIATKLDEQKMTLSMIEEREGTADPQILYGTPEAEVEFIKKEIANLLAVDFIGAADSKIKGLRNNIENYFSNLVK